MDLCKCLRGMFSTPSGIPVAPLDHISPYTAIGAALVPIFTVSMRAILREIAARQPITVRQELLDVVSTLFEEGWFSECAPKQQEFVVRRLFQLLGQATPHDISRLVHSSRYIVDIGDTCLAKLSRFEKYPIEVSVPWAGLVAALAPDGHVREEAVRTLNAMLEANTDSDDGHDDGLHDIVLPYILLRVCDWVPQVRSAALELLVRILPRVGLRTLFSSDPFLNLVQRSRRASPESLRHLTDRIVELAQAPDAKACLVTPPGTGRFVWKVLTSHAGDVPQSVWAAVSMAGPSFGRLMAARHLDVANWDEDRWRKVISEESQSDPKVRRAWLWRLMDQPAGCSSFVDRLYRNALFDESSLVREIAAYALRTRYGIDPAVCYHERIAPFMANDTAEPPAAWAMGLAATGTAEADWFRRWCSSSDTRLRAAGLVGLSRTFPDEADGLAVEMVYDERRPSRIAAARWLTARRGANRVDEIRTCFENGGSASRRTALRILLDVGGITRIHDIFAALPYEDLRPRAWEAFITWGRRYGWHATSGSAPLAWNSLSTGERILIRDAWSNLTSQYAFDPPDEPTWAARISDTYPPPHRGAKRPTAHLGAVPYDAWKNWSAFPRLLQQLFPQ